MKGKNMLLFVKFKPVRYHSCNPRDSKVEKREYRQDSCVGRDQCG